jgi:predicted RNA binding protein YcfA (HicA-like mRNA interferase family)
MSPKLKNVKVRRFIKALKRGGFVLKRQHGSHRIYVHPQKGRQVIVPYHHSSETIPIGLMRSLIEDAGWTEDDLVLLKLMRKG